LSPANPPLAEGRFVVRQPVEGGCPECGGRQLARYRVLAEGGWFDVVKCGACLASIERTPGPAMGDVVRSFPLPPGRPRAGNRAGNRS
jgi:hypothetical protein